MSGQVSPRVDRSTGNRWKVCKGSGCPQRSNPRLTFQQTHTHLHELSQCCQLLVHALLVCCKVALQPVHEGHKAPKGINLCC